MVTKKRSKTYWLVIRAKSGQESRTAANVENHGNLEAYAPRIREYGKVKALFPTYAFAQVKNDDWAFVRRIKGVRGVLMAGESPAKVLDEVIEEIRAREKEGINQPFTLRQRLAIVGGPFSHGLYMGMSAHNRVRVLFELLGKETTKDMDIKRVRPASGS